MEGSLAEELYSESLKLSKKDLGSSSTSISKASDSRDCDVDDLQHEGELMWENSGEEFDESSELDREWQRRREQYHTHGYREGISAGKEASAQEGFNIGFKQSVLVGYNWGIVRGVTSALASLPDGLKERLIETEEKRDQFRVLYESVCSISTVDALRLFNDDLVAKKALEGIENAEASSRLPSLQDQSSGSNRLENYFVELQSLLSDCPALDEGMTEDVKTKELSQNIDSKLLVNNIRQATRTCLEETVPPETTKGLVYTNRRD